MMKSLLGLLVAMTLVPPRATVLMVDALLLECSCIPFVVMFSKQRGNDCFRSDWVLELIQELANHTLKAWTEAHPCGGGNATTTGGNATPTGDDGTGVHAFATSSMDGTNAEEEESEGYVAGNQAGFLTGMNQGFELGESLVCVCINISLCHYVLLETTRAPQKLKNTTLKFLNYCCTTF